MKLPRTALLSIAAIVAACTASPSPAPTPAPRLQAHSSAEPAATPTPITFDVPREPASDKSYVIPALEIAAFEILLNQWNRRVIDEDEYGSNVHSIVDNLGSSWVVDRDPFEVNQLWHPYAGSLYFGFARSAGLGFWEASGYTFLGSALWEIAGETSPPSLNDQISTAIGGSFIGEAFFRAANWILEGEVEPDGWRETAAAVISPPTWVNRHAFGDRFRTPYASGDPAIFASVGAGGSLSTEVSRQGRTDDVDHNHVVGNFELDYGLPGKHGDRWDEPFDYFHLEGSLTSSPDAFVENAFIRGLLLGREYGSGTLHGLVGVYGTYCYLSPQLFELSTTAASFGTTLQWWCARRIAVQGNLLGGVGYGAAGRKTDSGLENEYHYGIAPQAIAALRVIFWDHAMLDLSARDYYISGAGSSDSGHSENILREQAALTFRIHGRHALGLQYDLSRRDVPDAVARNVHQTVQTTSLVYRYLLGNTHERMSGVR